MLCFFSVLTIFRPRPLFAKKASGVRTASARDDVPLLFSSFARLLDGERRRCPLFRSMPFFATSIPGSKVVWVRERMPFVFIVFLWYLIMKDETVHFCPPGHVTTFSIIGVASASRSPYSFTSSSAY